MSDDEIVREGTCVRDVSSQAFIAAFANFLKQSEAVTPPGLHCLHQDRHAQREQSVG